MAYTLETTIISTVEQKDQKRLLNFIQHTHFSPFPALIAAFQSYIGFEGYKFDNRLVSRYNTLRRILLFHRT